LEILQLAQALIPVGVRSTSRRGGSVSINIPSQITKLMDLKAGDPIAFFYDPEMKRLIIEKISSFSTPSGLSFSVSKKMAKTLTRKNDAEGQQENV
jgi:bifunctional DNA-binding transcriptional regulator/antitoxin component of YhaV-PrlF toxin-antitoxin module